MNEDTLKIINEFILQSDIGILIGGPACIGKTHFSRYLRSQDGFVGVDRYPSKTDICREQILVPKILTINIFDNVHVRHSITKGKGIIIIGVPYDTWKERCILRKLTKHYNHGPEKFKTNYVNIINKLEEYSIPHIFIDSRNDYPVLDKSSFLAMLKYLQ